jgi:HSP20 family molecular chaperone IbpA
MATDTMTAAPPSTEHETERAVRTVSPRADIFETDTAFVILADMPGVGPDGVELVADKDTLVVRGRVSGASTNVQARQVEHREFELADYHRTFTLTEDLDSDGITGTLRDGVLRVEVPKSPRVQPKKIPVRAS